MLDEKRNGSTTKQRSANPKTKGINAEKRVDTNKTETS